MVIMRQDDCGGVHRQGLFDDLTWIDAGAVYGAAKQLLKKNNSVPVVEIQAAEQLVRQVTQPGGQKSLCIGGAADCLSCWQGRFEIPLGQFGKRPENREPCCTDTLLCRELLVSGLQQSPQAAKPAQQAA